MEVSASVKPCGSRVAGAATLTTRWGMPSTSPTDNRAPAGGDRAKRRVPFAMGGG